MDKARKVIEVPGELSVCWRPSPPTAPRADRDEVIDAAIAELAPPVGIRRACEAVGESRAHWYRRHRQSPPVARPARTPTPQPRALSVDERGRVREVADSPERVDEAPATVYAKLLDEGV